MKAAKLDITGGLQKGVRKFIKHGLEEKTFDSILIPFRTPAKDSYAWLLVNKPELLDDANPLPPVISIQGGKVVTSLTRRGKGTMKTLVMLRPCEARAVIELYKLKQTELENLILLTIDCPGSVSLKDYLQAPGEMEKTFEKIMENWGGEEVRPLCRVCDNFSMVYSDIHIGILGQENGKALLVPGTDRGKEVLEKLDYSMDEDVEPWENAVNKLTEERKEKRKEEFEKTLDSIRGTENFLEAFTRCINCHNCSRVCPVCYCRQCYFDSKAIKMPPGNYLSRAQKRGAFRFPADTMFFHLGRMSHMAVSCVSCGLCEDACPMDISVGQYFSIVGRGVQKTFGYIPGRDPEEELPLVTYRGDEFSEVEVPYLEIYRDEEQKITGAMV
ncbi:MAG: 4Fe-4S dicluster domain-containing protein [Candidatus Eremiobacteraeota bacterium]|nr:4Fe-4S dicluster domain-containing protein [Candidatus Eremiobacteraeota bacterium]